MAQRKGQTGNPKGRPKGSPNRITKEVREMLKEVVQRELEVLHKRMTGMTDAERTEVLLKLLPYVTPRLTESLQPDVCAVDRPDVIIEV